MCLQTVTMLTAGAAMTKVIALNRIECTRRFCSLQYKSKTLFVVVVVVVVVCCVLRQ
jgi:hypothetical protein